jgi:hypothetical protein
LGYSHHPLDQGGAIALLLERGWLVHRPGSRPARRRGAAFRILLRLTEESDAGLSVPLRNHLLADSNHITAFASSVLQLNAARYGLKSLPVKLPHRPWPAVVMTPRNRTLNPLVERFVECARAEVKMMMTS